MSASFCKHVSIKPEKPVHLAAPKNTPIKKSDLAKCDGVNSPHIYVAVKAIAFDVTANTKNYGPKGKYHLFAGKDVSKALAIASLNAKDCVGDCSKLNAKEKSALEEWFAFFSARYNAVGKVVA